MRALLLAAIVMLLLPVAAAQEDAEAVCIIFIRPMQDFRDVEIAADLILSPEQRTNLSDRIDLDDDDNITGSEAATYENQTRIAYDAQTIPDERALSMDGRRALHLSLSTKLHGWTGTREEAEKGIVTELRNYRFPTSEQPTHELSGALYTRPIPLTPTAQVVIEVIVIDAPVGWLISRVTQADANGTTTNESSPDTPSVRLSGFDLSRGSVTFRSMSAQPTPIVTTPTSPVQPSSIPAPGAAVVTIALALGALVASAARRRRRG